jgi:hypothetical protein
MEERLSREEILSQLQIEHDRFAMTLARLTPEQMIEPGAVGFWSVKDVLASLIYWNVFTAQVIDAALRGQPIEHPLFSDHEITARTVEQHQWLDLNAVCAGFEATYNMVHKAVQDLPDEAFIQEVRIEAMWVDAIHMALANNTYGQWSIHEAQIREWLE